MINSKIDAIKAIRYSNKPTITITPDNTVTIQQTCMGLREAKMLVEDIMAYGVQFFETNGYIYHSSEGNKE